ncbi:MAG: HYR domain-containing protein, partial [Ilumatobacteraceae bacterium]
GTPLPVASSLNYSAGEVVPNELVAKVGAGGRICLYTYSETHLLADVVGYLPLGPGYSSLDPARLLDTRSANSTVDGLFAGAGRRGAGSVTELVVAGRGGVSAGAAAVVVNVTVVDPSAPGFVTVFPCGTPLPVASSLNYSAGEVVPNELVAKVGAGGRICLYTYSETHLLADVVGYLP